MEKGWFSALKEEFNKPYMKDLQEFLMKEKGAGETIYPPDELIFNAFCQTAFDDVKVVIVGQDPYHGPNQAHGLAFSVQEGVTPPPSLENIFKELMSDVGILRPKTGSLINFARQGVLLLNATLTVARGKPKSHYGKGWEIFTDAVLEKLVQRSDPIVFLLWGKSAEEKVERVFKKDSHHLILKAAHPSPYSATGFFGCKHFSKTNEFLKKVGKKTVDWNVN